jgi:hypothetical protein
MCPFVLHSKRGTNLPSVMYTTNTLVSSRRGYPIAYGDNPAVKSYGPLQLGMDLLLQILEYG